ncbi:MAG: hypothetical protein M0P74_17405, partial [Syntrophales bacterium]|nr:hypothetical protein [Syntrophales bacterium]
LQNHLSFPNVSIGNMVFQAVRTRFPLRIVAGMTRMGSFAITSNEYTCHINKRSLCLFPQNGFD